VVEGFVERQRGRVYIGHAGLCCERGVERRGSWVVCEAIWEQGEKRREVEDRDCGDFICGEFREVVWISDACSGGGGRELAVTFVV
jgi:hypothetical protein